MRLGWVGEEGRDVLNATGVENLLFIGIVNSQEGRGLSRGVRIPTRVGEGHVPWSCEAHEACHGAGLERAGTEKNDRNRKVGEVSGLIAD